MNKKYNSLVTPALDLIKPAVQAVRNNLAAVLLLVVLPSMLINICLPQIFDQDNFVRTDTSGLWPWLLLVGIIWSTVSIVAFYIYQIKTLNGHDSSVSEGYELSFNYIARLIGVGLLTLLAVIGGLLLLIVPGLIMIRRYTLAPYYVIDKNMSVLEAMRTSSRQTKKYRGAVWSALGISLCLMIAAAILASVFGDKPPLMHVGEVVILLFAAAVNYVMAFRYLQIRNSFERKSSAVKQAAPKVKATPAKTAKRKTAKKA